MLMVRAIAIRRNLPRVPFPSLHEVWSAFGGAFWAGIVLFVTARVADLPFEAVTKATMPFLIPLLAVLLAIISWPPFTTWLPSMMR